MKWLGWCLGVWLLFSPAHAEAHADLDRRIDKVGQQIAASPNDASLYFKRGNLHRLHRDFDAAIADLARARELAPDAAVYRYLLGLTKFDAGDFSGALREFDLFLERVPESLDGLTARADSLAAMGRADEAIDGVDRAINVARSPSPDLYLKRARWQAKQGQTTVARKGLRDGLRKLGPVVSLLRLANELDVEAGEPELALARLNRLPVSIRSLAPWLVERARILTAVGRREHAKLVYQQARGRLADLPPARRNSRANLRLLSDIEQGLQALSKAR